MPPDLNFRVTVDEQVIDGYVNAVADRLARAMAQRLLAFVDHTTHRVGGDTWRTTFELALEQKQVATVLFKPGTNIIPVQGTGQVQAQVNAPQLDIDWLRSKLKEIVEEQFPRFVTRMVRVELR